MRLVRRAFSEVAAMLWVVLSVSKDVYLFVGLLFQLLMKKDFVKYDVCGHAGSKKLDR